jgi:type II secretory pathway pseudopilin PulG
MIKKRGMTIIELLVAMAIFIVVITLVVGAFASISRTNGMAKTYRNSQQKLRIAMEMITRYARQANEVSVSTVGGGSVANTLDLVYTKNTPNTKSTFTIDPSTGNLTLEECMDYADDTCNVSTTTTDLLNGEMLLDITTSQFEKTFKNQPELSITLKRRAEAGVFSQYYSDDFLIQNGVILEGLQ